MKNLAFFGGTFNPPHLAHKRLALQMQKEAALDEIFVVPTFVPPHKTAPQLLSGEDRLQMCRLLFTEEVFSVSDMELKRQGRSYSIDTVTELKRLYPEARLFMIVGSDMLLSFHRWYRYSDILQLATLCVASREGDEGRLRLAEYARETLGLNEKKGEIIISDMPPVELSSTEIRQLIKDGENAEKYLGAAVWEYICRKGLYR